MGMDTLSLVATLEDLLVREFRACQAILAATRKERLALARQDTAGVALAVEEKEALLDELARAEDQRRMAVQEAAHELSLSNPSPTVAEVAAALHPDEGGRLNRLREGILALSAEIQALTSGNRSLAFSALERVDALQTFLLDLHRPSLFYQPPGQPARDDPEATWGVDIGR